MCMPGAQRDQEMASDPLDQQSQMIVRHCGHWELNLAPLQEHCELLTNEPAFQSHVQKKKKIKRKIWDVLSLMI